MRSSKYTPLTIAHHLELSALEHRKREKIFGLHRRLSVTSPNPLAHIIAKEHELDR